MGERDRVKVESSEKEKSEEKGDAESKRRKVSTKDRER